ncbi:hypothetical protein LIER_40069 [Lithospermum erythrorhizon]|uniref:Uncharacterized protein n=1 Tax=Lithospermum erythrorhizon TaxID=34254 RepID=A0AAV3QT74_LITER
MEAKFYNQHKGRRRLEEIEVAVLMATILLKFGSNVTKLLSHRHTFPQFEQPRSINELPRIKNAIAPPHFNYHHFTLWTGEAISSMLV